MRSWLSTPLGTRLVGAAFAVAGVVLLVVGLIALRGQPGEPDPAPGALPTSTASPTGSAGSTGGTGSAAPSGSAGPAGAGTATPSTAPTTARPSPTPARTTRPAPTRARPAPRPARAPVTVLNNSTQTGLGQQAAATVERRGWQVVSVGNFAGRIPVTTAYYTPGRPAERAAAEQLAREFPQVQRVFPRYIGLPPTPPGVVLVVTRDWTN